MTSARRLRSFVTNALLLAGAVSLSYLLIGAASIVGVVKDSSGAVLPGVTVEATSPVLIEKARATVTDGEGRYRIAELRPGTYSVTFALAGFATFKRDWLELTQNFVATINAELRVGALTETIVVTGETPLVDARSVGRGNIQTQRPRDTQAQDEIELAAAKVMLRRLLTRRRRWQRV